MSWQQESRRTALVRPQGKRRLKPHVCCAYKASSSRHRATTPHCAGGQGTANTNKQRTVKGCVKNRERRIVSLPSTLQAVRFCIFSSVIDAAGWRLCPPWRELTEALSVGRPRFWVKRRTRPRLNFSGRSYMNTLKGGVTGRPGLTHPCSPAPPSCGLPLLYRGVSSAPGRLLRAAVTEIWKQTGNKACGKWLEAC